MAIELNPAEREILTGLLEKELEEVRSELHHTRGREYKDGLKERERLIRELLAKLAA